MTYPGLRRCSKQLRILILRLPQLAAIVALALAELGCWAEAADWQRKMIALRGAKPTGRPGGET